MERKTFRASHEVSEGVVAPSTRIGVLARLAARHAVTKANTGVGEVESAEPLPPGGPAVRPLELGKLMAAMQTVVDGGADHLPLTELE